MSKCNECKNEEGKIYQHDLCNECYESLFSISQNNEEPEFELKHDVAVISPSTYGHDLLYTYGTLAGETISGVIAFPNRYVFDPDVKVKDYEKLVEFILANIIVTDQSPNFEKVSWMFKEVGKN